MNKIETKNLVKIYGKRKVVNNISINIHQGEVVGILGPNGAGKSTTFYMILGLIKANEGHVFFDDKDITKLPMYKRAELGIGYLAQEPSIFHKLTVEQNIMAILETLKINKTERKRRLEEHLEELSLTKLAKQKAYTLSGGERRKLEITRSLVTSPSFLLMDEPFAGVDPLAVADIQDIIGKLKEKNIGVLITDHNVQETLKITDRAYIVFNGEILFSGTSRELVNNERAREVYLGERFINPFHYE
ncbi:MAG: LPS export ABC transporter ATP-binding protein [Candidatus Cloacimonetes bacterium]|nr:LPS export ABC transporter ATP-binding protein [Candidatus Cloacimonadota bacterium]MCF7812905.1 LPS export ABC transporter ATP-binding protein [Candidatus Cloacimonadota bacterium]MCF7867117.1 LPS export ABC transporter ATP-binding protein [Candidatus Cloacimonadota bacterium]MCF7882563.1 LPS export ABC transporter ATP-binding protein [Candidatus Cloacimonadota bacterium]